MENVSYETFDEGCANSHTLIWGPFPPNEVSRITQLIRKDRMKGWVGCLLSRKNIMYVQYRKHRDYVGSSKNKLNFFMFLEKYLFMHRCFRSQHV